VSYNPQITEKEKHYVEKKEKQLKDRGELDIIVSSLKDVGALHIGLSYLNNQE